VFVLATVFRATCSSCESALGMPISDAPSYLVHLCPSVSGIARGRSLGSAGREGHLSPVCSYHSHASQRFLCQ